MLFFLILGLLVGALTVIFALQNMVTITVNFLAWQIDGSLALILLLAVFAGVLMCLLLSIPELIKTYVQFSTLEKINKQLEADNANYKRIATEATATAHIISETSTL